MKKLLLILLTLPSFGALDFNGTTQLGKSIGVVPITAYPFTMAVKFVTDDATTSSSMLFMDQDGRRCGLYQGAGTCGFFEASGFVITAGAGVISTGSTIYSLVAVAHAANNHTVHLSGVASTSEGATFTQNPPYTNVWVGARQNTTIGSYFNGRLSEATIWPVALNTNQINAYHAGLNPLLISSTAPTFYAPLGGAFSPEINFAGTALTLSNSPAIAAHPKVYNP